MTSTLEGCYLNINWLVVPLEFQLPEKDGDNERETWREGPKELYKGKPNPILTMRFEN